MRGFAIIMVVMFHTFVKTYGEVPSTFCINNFLVLFSMPIFFFISGFFFYQEDYDWNFNNTIRRYSYIGYLHVTLLYAYQL